MAGFVLCTRSERALVGVDPGLVAVVRAAAEMAEMRFAVTEGVRSRARQEELLRQGRTKTLNSKHLVGRAIDLVGLDDIDGDGTVDAYDWQVFTRYIAPAMRLGAMAVGIDVVWGGVWDKRLAALPAGDLDAAMDAYAQRQRARGKRPFLDGPHFELA